MRKVTRILAILGPAVMLGSLAAWPQTAEIELTRAEIQKERQAVVMANLELTEEESLAFWPVYRDYRLEMARLGDRLVKLLTDYGANRDTLTDDQATAMLDEHLAMQSDEVAVRKKYARQFRKILPPKKVTRFFQIENKLDAIVRFELADTVPLVR